MAVITCSGVRGDELKPSSPRKTLWSARLPSPFEDLDRHGRLADSRGPADDQCGALRIRSRRTVEDRERLIDLGVAAREVEHPVRGDRPRAVAREGGTRSGARSAEERMLIGRIEAQSVGQRVDGAALGRDACASLEVADRANADTRSRGERFEGQVLAHSQRPQQQPEG